MPVGCFFRSTLDHEPFADLRSAVEHLSQDNAEPWNAFASQLSQSLSESQQQHNEPLEPGDNIFETEDQNGPLDPTNSNPDDFDPEVTSLEVFQFTMKDLDPINDSDDEAETDDDISDEELRVWLKDHVGQDWERIYHNTRTLTSLYRQ